VDPLQGFIEKRFIVKEVVVLETGDRSYTLYLYKFRAMEIFYEIRQVLRFLVECLSRIAMRG